MAAGGKEPFLLTDTCQSVNAAVPAPPAAMPSTGSALGCALCPVPLDGIAQPSPPEPLLLPLSPSQLPAPLQGLPLALSLPCPWAWTNRHRLTAELLLQEELEVLPAFRVPYQLAEVKGPSLHAHPGGDFHAAQVGNKQHCGVHTAQLIGRWVKTKMPFAGTPRDFSALSVFQNAVMSS